MRRVSLLFVTLAITVSSSSAKQPNVIVIMTDDQGYGDMACHGNPWLKTPNLDRLAAESIQLEDYHVDPVCTPTRAALMTGRYSSRVGAWTVTEGRQLLNSDEVTMADVFAASGYRTGMFGKWHLGDSWPYAPGARGFQEVVCHQAGGVDEIGNPAGNDFFDDTYYHNGQPKKFRGYCTDVFFREAMRFIRQPGSGDAGKPFFVYLALNAMHGPFTVAEEYSAPFAAQGHAEKRAKFYGMIANFDENLGRLLESLKQWDLERDTLVIFMGDNGSAAGAASADESNAGFNAGMRGKKGSVYDGGHRVACFVRWPGKLKAGHAVHQITSHRDWLPTLIDLCGLKIPGDVAFDGQSIAPLLVQQATDWPDRTLFIERQGDRPELTRNPAARNRYPQYTVLTEKWRLVSGKLYDIVADPGQQRDVTSSNSTVADELFAAYEKHFADVYPQDSAYTRFQIGSANENRTGFTVRDWHPTDGNVIWKSEQLDDDDLFINGFWPVEILSSGRYAIHLSRFPQDVSAPMGANRARLQMSDIDRTLKIHPGDSSVTFEVELTRGRALLQTWLTDAGSGRQRGAYFVTFERRPARKAVPFPAVIPQVKPTDRPLSVAMQRLYDVWNPHEDRGNELYSNFKYSPLKGLSYEGNISRRDPSKVLKIDGTYYVWYTRRDTEHPPSGPQQANKVTPSFDWDLCEIWYATSKDGFTWEEQRPAIRRPAKGEYGWRSVSTPDILAWGGRFYLYYQGFNEIPGLKGDRAATTVAEADSPVGPWRPLGRVVVDFGAEGEWDSNAIHDPYPIVYRGRIYLYYKGSPGRHGEDGTLVRAQGVAIADHPKGPFIKSPLNPVTSSGHETCFFPWKDGVAAIVSLDGPEKNTVQFAPDGINFEVKSLLQIPPIAPGAFVPDAFADNGNGRGIVWGLCHINPDGGAANAHSILARFDCDLSREVDRRAMKNNNLRFDQQTYFQKRVRLPEYLDRQIRRERNKLDTDTVMYRSDSVAGSRSRKTSGIVYTGDRILATPATAAPTKAFPAVMPWEKPADRILSAAWARMWDRWNPHEDRGNELYSNFKYTPLEGLKHEPNVSRRDPTKVIRLGGKYYVWYTCRRTTTAPVGVEKATETIPATDWDLADIWYATSDDGYTWTEQGVAVKRPENPIQGFRSICTPDILLWKGKYYLYFQAYSPMVGRTAYCPVMAAVADSPDGPWTLHEEPVIEPGPEGSWNNIKINDPCLLVVNDRILMYYKGAPREQGDEYVLRMQGVSFADHPLGPFVPSKLNPVINSGHETCMWPWKGGVAALVALDGPEKNTIQFAPDGENFEVMSIIQVPPIAPGPFVPDAFASDGDGRGITWGLSHINPDGGGATSESILVRFDCDLSLNVDRPVFKRNNLRFEQSTYFQARVRLPDFMRRQIDEERDRVDRDTIQPAADNARP